MCTGHALSLKLLHPENLFTAFVKFDFAWLWAAHATQAGFYLPLIDKAGTAVNGNTSGEPHGKSEVG